MQGGLFSCSLPLDAIIHGREEAGEPIRSLLACQPKTNCLLALTAGFYLHNSNPKAKPICTRPTRAGGVVFTERHMREEDGEWWVCGGGLRRIERERGGKNVGSNRTAAESIAVTLPSLRRSRFYALCRVTTPVASACSGCLFVFVLCFFFFFFKHTGVFSRLCKCPLTAVSFASPSQR